MSKPTIGMVFSGGGMRGVAHIGVLRALKRLDIQPDIIAGASAGAIVGALYAANCSTQEMLGFWETNQPFRLENFNYRKAGLIDSDKMIQALEDQFTQRTFEELTLPLHIAVTEMVSGESHIISTGSLIPAIVASAAFPIVFSPVEIEGKVYQDGGIVNNFPSECLKDHCDILIGVNVSPMRTIDREQLDSTVAIAERVYELATDVNTRHKRQSCDVLIEPSELANYSTFDTDQIGEVFKIGYDATLEKTEEIQALLSGSTR